MYATPLPQADALLGFIGVTPFFAHVCGGFVTLALPGQLQLVLQQDQ
jgi:hypothetical protein